MDDKSNELLAMAAANSRTRKWSRTYLYGWCRMNEHNRLAWLFADRWGRQFLRELRAVEKFGRQQLRRTRDRSRH